MLTTAAYSEMDYQQAVAATSRHLGEALTSKAKRCRPLCQ